MLNTAEWLQAHIFYRTWAWRFCAREVPLSPGYVSDGILLAVLATAAPLTLVAQRLIEALLGLQLQGAQAS